MINTYKNGNLTWIDLDNPTQDEVRKIADQYSIDLLIADELLSPSARPTVDYQDNYVYLILHFPTINDLDHTEYLNVIDKIQEVDFIIGKNFIITTRYSSVDALLEFSKTFEVDSVLDRSELTGHGGYIFFFMIQHLYKSLSNRIESIRDTLIDIEGKIFKGEERDMVVEISRVNRLLLNYRESIMLHKEVLESFEIAGQSLFGKNFSQKSRAILGEYYKVQNSIKSSKEYLDELRSTNDSLLTTKQNEITKILTIMAFVTFPLSLIAGIFGMNTEHMPIVGRADDFEIIVGMMLVLTGIMFLFFRFKKWI